MISHEEQQLRDSKFLAGQFAKQNDSELHDQIVKDHAAGYSLEVIADINAINVNRVTFELNVEAQMRAWHG